MEGEEGKLLLYWHNKKDDIGGFLADPLKWVADELEKACAAIPLNRSFRRGDLDTIETLTDIIRFINAHRNLLTTNK